MSTIKIPKTIEDAQASLGKLGELLTAKEWQRAAIVATFVEPATAGRRAKLAETSQFLSARAFAQLGISGLKSKDTVMHYVESWLAERPRPEPGQTIDLAGLPDWPPNPTVGRNVDPERMTALRAGLEDEGYTGVSKAIDIASNPKAMTAAILHDPATAKAAEGALAERAVRRMAARGAVVPKPTQRQTQSRAMIDALGAVGLLYQHYRRLHMVLDELTNDDLALVKANFEKVDQWHQILRMALDGEALDAELAKLVEEGI